MSLDSTEKEVRHVLGILFRGTHNMDYYGKLKPLGRCWEFTTDNDFSTYDNSNLTTLVLASHHYGFRASIRPKSKDKLVIQLFKIGASSVESNKGHPTITQALENFERVLEWYEKLEGEDA